MTKKVTSITLHKTGLGDQAAITYSLIDESGKIIYQNKRREILVVNEDILSCLDAIYNYALNQIDMEE